MQPERDHTDDSLRAERSSTDDAIVERLASSEAHADVVVEHAREQADAVLESARGRVDQKLNAADAGPDVRATIAAGRAIEDQVLRDERAVADDLLRHGREHQTLILAALLPLERQKTDRDLLTERGRADARITNRDDFLGMVTHDLRNLLCGVMLEASQLSSFASASADDVKTVVGLTRLQRYVARMNSLIGDLVDVVSIDAGKLAVRPQHGDGAALLAEAVDTFKPAALEKDISLQLETGARVLAAQFDRGRMLQVLSNLIGNALKFTPPGGSILVHGECAADGLRLTITDTGVGIPAHLLDAIFERFWQVGENDRRGLGLGLHISKCIVDAHGGRIWAESELGAGSSFVVTLPDAFLPAA